MVNLVSQSYNSVLRIQVSEFILIFCFRFQSSRDGWFYVVKMVVAFIYIFIQEIRFSEEEESLYYIDFFFVERGECFFLEVFFLLFFFIMEIFFIGKEYIIWLC